MHYDMKKCGARIQQLRKAKGMTQEELSAVLGIGDRHLRKIESGERGPSTEIFVELSELFHVSLDYIIVGKKPQDNLKKRLFAVIQELSAVTDEL